MKVVKRVFFAIRLRRIVSVDEMQFVLCLRGSIDAVFMLRSMQVDNHAKVKKLYMCFVDL